MGTEDFNGGENLQRDAALRSQPGEIRPREPEVALPLQNTHPAPGPSGRTNSSRREVASRRRHIPPVLGVRADDGPRHYFRAYRERQPENAKPKLWSRKSDVTYASRLSPTETWSRVNGSHELPGRPISPRCTGIPGLCQNLLCLGLSSGGLLYLGHSSSFKLFIYITIHITYVYIHICN